jgi:hypothetical protein
MQHARVREEGWRDTGGQVGTMHTWKGVCGERAVDINSHARKSDIPPLSYFQHQALASLCHC